MPSMNAHNAIHTQYHNYRTKRAFLGVERYVCMAFLYRFSQTVSESTYQAFLLSLKHYRFGVQKCSSLYWSTHPLHNCLDLPPDRADIFSVRCNFSYVKIMFGSVNNLNFPIHSIYILICEPF